MDEEASKKIRELEFKVNQQEVALKSKGKIIVDMANADKAITPKMMEAMAPILTNPMIQYLDREVQILSKIIFQLNNGQELDQESKKRVDYINKIHEGNVE